MCSIIGVGERLHKVLGQIDLGTLDSGERSLPFGLLVMGSVPFFSITPTGPDSSVGRVSAPGNGGSRVRSRAATYQSRKKWY